MAKLVFTKLARVNPPVMDRLQLEFMQTVLSALGEWYFDRKGKKPNTFTDRCYDLSGTCQEILHELDEQEREEVK